MGSRAYICSQQKKVCKNRRCHPRINDNAPVFTVTFNNKHGLGYFSAADYILTVTFTFCPVTCFWPGLIFCVLVSSSRSYKISPVSSWNFLIDARMLFSSCAFLSFSSSNCIVVVLMYKLNELFEDFPHSQACLIKHI